MATSGSSTSAIQSQEVTKIASSTAELRTVSTETAAIDEPESNKVSLVSNAAVETESIFPRVNERTISRDAAQQQQLLQDEWELFWTEQNETLSNKTTNDDPLAAVELAPLTKEAVSESKTLSASQHDLVQRLKTAQIPTRSVTTETTALSKQEVLTAESLRTSKVSPLPEDSSPNSTRSVAVNQSNQEQASQQDPLGSSYPIPWQWIQATQEAISSRNGRGTRYYRSLPVVSPDGRYAIYSRVQLEVEPEMYNSRVTSVLFVEDRQTRKLQVINTTSAMSDPLLKSRKSSPDRDRAGAIGVLVPVSWSKNGACFLARKFEGVMNTSDLTDHAVIWDRQKNHTSTVAPSPGKNDQEKIAVLLGWSTTHPDHALFRAGEMGEENWSLVTVASDGTSITGNEADQPITFGQKARELWAEPSVAYR